MNNIISDDYYNYIYLIDISKYKKKEPYVFTITSTNSIGSTTSDATSDILPLTVPSISNFVITPSFNLDPEIQSAVSLNMSFSVDNGGSDISSFVFDPNNSGNLITISAPFSLLESPVVIGNSIGILSRGVIPIGASGTYNFLVTNLSPATNYSFKLIANNSVGSSSPSVSNDTKTYSVPDAPTNVSAVSTANKECTVTFTDPTNNGGVQITKYIVTATPSTGTPTVQTGTSTSIKVTGLTGGTSYTFTVKAVNAIGSSLNSTPSTSVKAYDVPTAPIISSVSTNENIQSTVVFSGGNLNGSEPASPLYTVTATPVTGSPITQTGDSSPITIRGLTNGVKYTFKVTISSTTNNASATSPTYDATLSNVPDKIDIKDIVLTPNNNLIKLKFKKPNSNGSDITNYIFNAYYTDSTGKIYKEIINVPANQVTVNSADDTITVEFRTTQRNKYDSSKQISSLTSAEINSVTTNTLNLNAPVVQKYDKVFLEKYPVGKERKNNSFKSVCFYICLIIFIFIIIVLFRKYVSKSL